MCLHNRAVSHLDQYPWRRFHKARRSCQAVVDLDKCQPHTSAGSYQSHTHVLWQGSSRFQVGAIGCNWCNDTKWYSHLVFTHLPNTFETHVDNTQLKDPASENAWKNALKMWNASKTKIWNTTHCTQFLTLVLGSSSAAEIGCLCVSFILLNPYAEYMSPNRS